MKNRYEIWYWQYKIGWRKTGETITAINSRIAEELASAKNGISVGHLMAVNMTNKAQSILMTIV